MRTVLVTVSIAIALGAGELAVRIHRHNGHGLDAAAAADAAFVGPRPRSIMDVIRPNSDLKFGNVRYRFDHRMIRGGERYDDEPPAGVFRIVITGDSVTMGHGVAEDKTYAALLERALNEAAGRKAFEVVNLGISNLNAQSAMNRLEHTGLPLHPNMIVYGDTINDIEGRNYDAFSDLFAAYAARSFRFRHSDSFLLRALWPRLVDFETLWWHPPGSYVWILEQNYFHNPAAWHDVDDALGRLAEMGRRLGVCAHVFVHAQIYSTNFLHPFTAIYDRLGSAGAAHGLTVTQSYPYFRGRFDGDLIVSNFDRHPNAAGHALMFRALYDGLRRLPESCWTIPHPTP